MTDLEWALVALILIVVLLALILQSVNGLSKSVRQLIAIQEERDAKLQELHDELAQVPPRLNWILEKLTKK